MAAKIRMLKDNGSKKQENAEMVVVNDKKGQRISVKA